MNRLSNGSKGLAEIGAAITIAIVVGSTIIVLNTIGPMMEEGRQNQEFLEEKNNIALIDKAITQLMLEASGARRQLDLDMKKGTLIVSGDEEKIKIRMEGYGVIQPGTSIQEGNIHIESGGGIDALETDIDKDGSMDLVLRNNLLTFAIRKIGNLSNYSLVTTGNINMTSLLNSSNFINTSNMITWIYNNRTNTGIVPIAAIYVNDVPETSYGIGYTILTRKGTNLGDGSILVAVKSASGVYYEALFTLYPGADFIEMKVKNVQ